MTKTTTLILGIALAGLVAMAGAGCKREAAAPKMPTYSGVQVDMPKLQQTVGTIGPEAQTIVRNVRMGLRYGRYVDSLMALDKLKELPGLNDAQKQVVNEVIEQVTQAAKNKEAKAAKAAQ
jgi:hypothetical protein